MNTKLNLLAAVAAVEVESIVNGIAQASPGVAAALAMRDDWRALAQQALLQRSANLLDALTTDSLAQVAAGAVDLGATLRQVTSKTPAATASDTPAQTIAKIAQDVLDIETLETRSSDRLDFYSLAVWSVRAALVAAYDAGAGAALPGRLAKHPCYNHDDYLYLRGKGFDDAQILERWDSEHADGRGPCAWDHSTARGKLVAVTSQGDGTTEASYLRFVEELTQLTRKYGVALNAVGGVMLASSPGEFANVTYRADYTSGDLFPDWD